MKDEAIISKCSTLGELFSCWAEEERNEPDEEYAEYHKRNDVPKNNFCIDGFIDKESYDSAKKKVLFIAKESHIGPNVEIPYSESENKEFWASREVRKAKQEGAKLKNTFLKGMAMLYNDYLCDRDPQNTAPDKSTDNLSDVAFMNLNKRGGYVYCVWKTLCTYVEKYAVYIRKEIEIIDPDLVVCCGQGVRDLVDRFELAKGRKVVTAYHPSYFRRSDEEKRRFFRNNLHDPDASE